VIHEQLSTIEDRDAWEEAMPAHISVFGSIGYARIVQRHIGYPARLFVVSSGAGRIVYPFFLRPVANLPFAKQYAPFWDSLTPEYTGPMAWGEVTPLLRYFFNERWNRLCEEQGIVAEFAHLHPSERAADLLDSAHVQFNREIVVIDLTLPEEELLRHSFSLSCRNNIRRAQREQVRVVEGRTDADVREFHRIYTMTMERRQAHKRYFFSLDYFLAFRDELPDNTLFLFAVHRDRAIAAHLYLYDDEEMHDFLGGMEEEHKQLRPTNAIIYAAIQWGRRHGKRRLILGGGYQPNDGIYQFKASFSPLRARFSTYRRVRHPTLYADLCQAWTEYYGCALPRDATYFPAYRMLPPQHAGLAREVGG
jgi:serine/alanine adding enzyme